MSEIELIEDESNIEFFDNKLLNKLKQNYPKFYFETISTRTKRFLAE